MTEMVHTLSPAMRRALTALAKAPKNSMTLTEFHKAAQCAQPTRTSEAFVRLGFAVLGWPTATFAAMGTPIITLTPRGKLRYDSMRKATGVRS